MIYFFVDVHVPDLGGGGCLECVKGVERGAQGRLLEQGDADGNLRMRADDMYQKTRCDRIGPLQRKLS